MGSQDTQKVYKHFPIFVGQIRDLFFPISFLIKTHVFFGRREKHVSGKEQLVSRKEKPVSRKETLSFRKKILCF